jgi:hypothetical protein
MPRADLLALSPDDLAALTNRGIVKRAQRELDEDEVKGELSETAEGDVTVKWSDGPESRLPARIPLPEANCTCEALGLCRHIVRAVLFYQRHTPAESSEWDPGAIVDEALTPFFQRRQLTRLRQQFDEGLLVELLRGSKPTARFHDPACVVRFQVPGELRYALCDCAADARPCVHVPLALWAFRRMAPADRVAILSTSPQSPPPPVETLDRIDAMLSEHLEQGVSGSSPAWKDRLVRLEQDCLSAGLTWPADIVGELIVQQEGYTSHDARFAPDEVVELIGELHARAQAIRCDSGALPQLLIRGTRGDCRTDLKKTNFVGLGCGVRVGRRRAVLTAFMQDEKTGTMSAVTKSFPDPEASTGQKPRSFADLSHLNAVTDISFAALGVGRLTLERGRRTARGILQPLRSTGANRSCDLKLAALEWENIHPPVLVEDFVALAIQPPSCLGSRRVAEDIRVLRVAGVEGVHFDPVGQNIVAALHDAGGHTALLVFPYTSRGQGGAEALLARLNEQGANLRFVSGPVRGGAVGLIVEPVTLVFQSESGRLALQPWIDAGQASASYGHSAPPMPALDPLRDVSKGVQEGLEELLVVGLQRADVQIAQRWRDLQQRAEGTGLARLSMPLRGLADELERKSHTLRWDAMPGGRLVLEIAMLLRLAQDVSL